jgi:hypothetical protein
MVKGKRRDEKKREGWLSHPSMIHSIYVPFNFFVVIGR